VAGGGSRGSVSTGLAAVRWPNPGRRRDGGGQASGDWSGEVEGRGERRGVGETPVGSAIPVEGPVRFHGLGFPQN
jgi:hypothetical protein